MKKENSHEGLENDQDGQLSLEVDHALEKEIGRAEIAAVIDALLEEGYHVKSPEEIIDLMEPFVHDNPPAHQHKPDQ